MGIREKENTNLANAIRNCPDKDMTLSNRARGVAEVLRGCIVELNQLREKLFRDEDPIRETLCEDGKEIAVDAAIDTSFNRADEIQSLIRELLARVG